MLRRWWLALAFSAVALSAAGAQQISAPVPGSCDASALPTILTVVGAAASESTRPGRRRCSWTRSGARVTNSAVSCNLQLFENSRSTHVIDSLVKRLDDRRFARKFTPRRADSRWSTVNKQPYAALEASGRLKPARLEALAPPHRRRYIAWIESAKREETKTRRLEGGDSPPRRRREARARVERRKESRSPLVPRGAPCVAIS